LADIEVVLSAHLARYARNETRFSVPSGTFRQVIDQVYSRHPDLRGRLADDAGEILPFINIYVGQDNVRDLGSYDLPVRPERTVLITSAVAGG
jgi:molybdopterin converting factor small subunit